MSFFRAALATSLNALAYALDAEASTSTQEEEFEHKAVYKPVGENNQMIQVFEQRAKQAD